MRNLTQLEIQALLDGVNVSDGHPRMPLTESQRAIVDALAALFVETEKARFAEVELTAQEAFLHGLGQLEAPTGTGRLLSCYSSSVAMDIVARTLAGRTRRVALVHPTFDNIPDLLRARGLDLVPLSEEELATGHVDLPDDVGAVFVTTPNNPTGWVLEETALRSLAEQCAATGRVLAIDSCFRGQEPRAQYDMYAVLDASGAEWVVIEDTGKLWPVQELKVGLLAWGHRTRLPLEDAFSDVLLSVSPFVLLLVTHLARDANSSGYAQLHQLVAENRAALARHLEGTGLALTDPDARISVARLTLPGPGLSQRYYEAILRKGVHTLPCDPFHWARREEGTRYLRISLARSRDEIELVGRVLATLGPVDAEQ